MIENIYRVRRKLKLKIRATHFSFIHNFGGVVVFLSGSSK